MAARPEPKRVTTTLEEKGIQQALDTDPKDFTARAALLDLFTELEDPREQGCRALLRWGRVPRFTATAWVKTRPTIWDQDIWEYTWDADQTWWDGVLHPGEMRHQGWSYVQQADALPLCWTSALLKPLANVKAVLAAYGFVLPGKSGTDYYLWCGGTFVERAALETFQMLGFLNIPAAARRRLLTKEVPPWPSAPIESPSPSKSKRSRKRSTPTPPT